MNYALILSGGSGTRLWPISRRARPKHLIVLTEPPSLLEQTLDRLDNLLSPSKRYLITIPEQAPLVRDIARGRAEGIIIEPTGLNNLLPMALSTRYLASKDPEARIVFLPADHSIRHPERLREALTRAFEVAGEDYLVTLGIPTSHPEPNYGHVQIGKQLNDFAGDYPVYKVRKFHEKPPMETAEEYTGDDHWYWNSGIFIFAANAMLDVLRQYLPEFFEIIDSLTPELSQIQPTIDNPVIDFSSMEAIAETYRTLPRSYRTSIDFAVMEKAEKVATIPVEMGWSDLGGFDGLTKLLEPDENGNRVASRHDDEEPMVLLPGCENVSVFPGKRAVVCLDCRDLIIVNTSDAVLVLPGSSSRKVGDVVNLIRQQGWSSLL